MKLKLHYLILSVGVFLLPQVKSKAQITLLQDYVNYKSAPIGTFQEIDFREAGFSSLYPIPNTNGREFWTISDRGVNVDCANANLPSCRPTYDKLYGFPNYAPKIHRIRVNGDSIQILQTITMKRPDGTGATGVLNPTGFGSTATENASTDTVQNCANYASKIAPKDIWGIDSEGIVVDKDGNFWICEEGGPSIWKLNRNGVVVKRYTPYANLPGAQPEDVAIDTVFKYRKNNRGFESIAITPSGKIYALIQSPLLNPTQAIGEGTKIHRILEIDPATNNTRMFVYLNQGLIGSGSNQIRLRDWKTGDMAAINDNEFLVIEAGARGTTDSKKVYKISLVGATPVTSDLYSGKSVEALVDETGLAANNITPVAKTLFLDLLANGWPSALDKSEGLAIINDSTIAVGNDNDYGQTCPNADGIAIATSNLSHLLKFGLKGTNKLSGYIPPVALLADGQTGPSTSQTPYLLPTIDDARFTSIISAKDVIGGYKMCGTPDGLGAFDNGNGTFTLLMNHEFGNTAGVPRAHGSMGAFVSKWIINKSDLSVVSGGDLIQNIKLWNGTGYTNSNASNPSSLTALNRFCSADLPSVSAFYNSATGLGTQERIFMNGEEAGNEGRAFGHIATGSEAGTTYELPALGKFSWENSVANPAPADKTVVVGMDDSTPGQVYVYVGTKTNSGSDVDKAGLTNGRLYGVSVTGLLTETNAGVPSPGTAFTLVDLGDVKNSTGTALNTTSNNLGVTTFLRPEDGAWDPSSPNDFYFNTTNAITSPSRLWRLHFTDSKNPEQGGTIEAVLDGTEGQKMLDNMTIDHYGHVLLVEDVGNNAHVGRVLQYDIATDVLTLVGEHDRTRFLAGGANFLTQDEEASGILDVQSILGPGMFLLDVQAHYAISGEVVEGGQLLAFYNPDSYKSNPEISLQGNGVNITNGDVTPSTADNTDFGTVESGSTLDKTFSINNAGPGNLNISVIYVSGANASDFSLVSAPSLPLTINAGSSQTITVRFAASTLGLRNAKLSIASNDFDEANYEFSIQGKSVSSEINVKGGSVDIVNGSTTISASNNTDFGNITSMGYAEYTIANTGTTTLNISGIIIIGNGSEFSLYNAPSFPLTIAAGSTQKFVVKFVPSALGTRTATVTIANSDLDESSYTFAIGAKAVAPEINVLGNNVSILDGDVTVLTNDNTDFGSVSVNHTITKSFIIQNTGTGNLDVTGLNITGRDAAEFSFVNNSALPMVIKPGESQTINVKYSPIAAGTHMATISIENYDKDEATYDFAIQGLGALSTGTIPNGSLAATGLMVYPNPAGDMATVSLIMEKEEQVVISIFDVKGNQVATPTMKSLSKGRNEIILNTSNLENGVYNVKISSDTGATSVKTIVAH